MTIKVIFRTCLLTLTLLLKLFFGIFIFGFFIFLISKNFQSGSVLFYETVIYEENPTVDLDFLDKKILKALSLAGCGSEKEKNCLHLFARQLRDMMFGVSPMSANKEHEMYVRIEKKRKYKQILKEVECSRAEIAEYRKKVFGEMFEYSHPADFSVPKPYCLNERKRKINQLPKVEYSKTSWVNFMETIKDLELLRSQEDFDLEVSHILEKTICYRDNLDSASYNSDCISDIADKVSNLKSEINRILEGRKAEKPTYEEMVTKTGDILADMKCDWEWKKGWWMGKPVPDCAAEQAKAIRKLIFKPLNISEREESDIQKIVKKILPPKVKDPEVCKSGLLDWANKENIYELPDCMKAQLKKAQALDKGEFYVDKKERERKLSDVLLVNHLEKSIAIDIAKKQNCDRGIGSQDCIMEIVSEIYDWDPQRPDGVLKDEIDHFNESIELSILH